MDVRYERTVTALHGLMNIKRQPIVCIPTPQSEFSVGVGKMGGEVFQNASVLGRERVFVCVWGGGYVILNYVWGEENYPSPRANFLEDRIVLPPSIPSQKRSGIENIDNDF